MWGQQLVTRSDCIAGAGSTVVNVWPQRGLVREIRRSLFCRTAFFRLSRVRKRMRASVEKSHRQPPHRPTYDTSSASRLRSGIAERGTGNREWGTERRGGGRTYIHFVECVRFRLPRAPTPQSSHPRSFVTLAVAAAAGELF